MRRWCSGVAFTTGDNPAKLVLPVTEEELSVERDEPRLGRQHVYCRRNGANDRCAKVEHLLSLRCDARPEIGRHLTATQELRRHLRSLGKPDPVEPGCTLD